MNLKREFNFRQIAVIVAHPDDETLWAGGLMLMNPQCHWTIICLCRGKDRDRSPKFLEALTLYGATGAMGNLDDGPEQSPVPQKEMETAIRFLLPPRHYDLILTHSPAGEYTRHKRHEETGRAVFYLWEKKIIDSGELWFFAYDDHNKTVYPEAVRHADRVIELPEDIRLKKYAMMTRTYGFPENSFEAMTTPAAESFWCFNNGEKTNNENNAAL
ncbi:MAG: PIG-L family deacetylase [Desulfobacula sp.]|jgi:LmbE family N-acetylglucosaminyl deacetylase